MKGITVCTRAKTFATTSPLIAEAISLREAMVIAMNMDLQDIIFEFDSPQLIQACKGEMLYGEIQHIVKDLRLWQINHDNWNFAWIGREGNKGAHTIAKLTLNEELMDNWAFNHPTTLREALQRVREMAPRRWQNREG